MQPVRDSQTDVGQATNVQLRRLHFVAGGSAACWQGQRIPVGGGA
jgi:hypothetical protein